MTSAATSYLVTGATGFIGKRLVSRLSAESATVHCLVTSERGQAVRLPPLPGVVALDAGPNDGSLTERIGEARPQIVINLAAQGVDPISRDPESLLNGNVGIFTRLLEALSMTAPRLVLHIGSWSEYADMTGTDPISEDHPLTPRSVYGAAKAATTIFGSALARQAGIPLVTLRLFNVFGVGEAPHRLIPYLIDRLGRSEQAELTPGDQTRDLTYVDDVADAIVLAGKSHLEPFSAYNICSGKPTQMRWVAERVADMMGQPRSLLRFGALPRREDEPQVVVGNHQRFANATGWRPRTSVEEGIGLMIENLSTAGLDS